MVADEADRSVRASGAADAEAAMLAPHDIVRLPADGFDADCYRYTNLADAVAQAKRSLAVAP